jgi:hypothetical protein
VRQLPQKQRIWSVSTGRALARREGFNDSYITRVVRMAFLSPAEVEAVLSGRQHRNLDATLIRSAGTIPASWQEQAERFLPS